jgi:hypothetical protein
MPDVGPDMVLPDVVPVPLLMPPVVPVLPLGEVPVVVPVLGDVGVLAPEVSVPCLLQAVKANAAVSAQARDVRDRRFMDAP